MNGKESSFRPGLDPVLECEVVAAAGRNRRDRKAELPEKRHSSHTFDGMLSKEKMATAKKSTAKSKRDDDKTDLKEIYVQPDLVKKPAFPKSENHVDPNIMGVPLDYSFRKVNSLAELEYGTPREYRVGIPRKGRTGKFVSSTLWANYNSLTDLNSVSSLVKVSFHKPEMIAWLDVSFNEIELVSNEILTLRNLKILYLHGNKIKYFIEVSKLKPLNHLRTLTLHGNPIVEHPNYRATVIKTLPQLVNLDFSLITK